MQIITKLHNQRPNWYYLLTSVWYNKIEEIIQGSDPDGDPVKIEVFGDPIEISASPATYAPVSVFQPSPGVINFEWQTICSHVREREYQVRIRITDQPRSGPALVDIKTWNIKVIGPPPVLEDVEQQQGRAVDVQWQPYSKAFRRKDASLRRLPTPRTDWVKQA